MLTIVTNSTGGQVTAGDGVLLAQQRVVPGQPVLDRSGRSTATTRSPTGRSWARSIILANNVTTQAFANITTLPVGQPGNPEVYAQPNPPQMFSG